MQNINALTFFISYDLLLAMVSSKSFVSKEHFKKSNIDNFLQ